MPADSDLDIEDFHAYVDIPPVAGDLTGETAADLEGHMAARAALMTLLMDDPDVDALFARWDNIHPFGRAARASREVLARAASIAGFATAQDLMDALEAAEGDRLRLPTVASQDEADAIGRELAAMVPEMDRRLDAMLAAVRGIDLNPLVPDAIDLVRDRWRLPWPWLAWELVQAWGQEAAAGGLGRFGVVRFGVVVDELAAPAPRIAFETRPGETIAELMLRSLEEVYAPLEAAAGAAALRAGKRTPLDVVERYVGWWYRHRILGESLRLIAGKNDGKRPHVRKGIDRAEGWLGAVGWTWADEDEAADRSRCVGGRGDSQ